MQGASVFLIFEMILVKDGHLHDDEFIDLEDDFISYDKIDDESIFNVVIERWIVRQLLLRDDTYKKRDEECVVRIIF